MRVWSDNLPSPIWVRNIEKTAEGLKAAIRVRWNAHEILVPDTEPGTERKAWEYEEQEVYLPLPQDINSIDALSNYIKEHEMKLIVEAKKKAIEEKKEEEKVSTGIIPAPKPWYADIETIRLGVKA